VGIVQAGRTCFEGSIAHLHETVRRVAGAEPPAEFERLRGDIYRAEPSQWDMAIAAGLAAGNISLEDIFLAFARTDGTAA
jgi:hypothetical protein